MDNGYNLNITHEELVELGMLVGIGSSQLTEWIDMENLTTSAELQQLHSQLKSENKHKQAKNLEFISEIIQVEYGSDKQFRDRFTLNGTEYVWINSKGDVTNTYIRADLEQTILTKMHNGRNVQKPFIPAKLNAYLGLTLSDSKPVTTKPKQVVVVNDAKSTFMATYTYVGVDGVRDVTKEVTIDASDGNGVIDYKLLNIWCNELGYQQDKTSSGVSVRNAFVKGMLFPVDLQKFFAEHNVTHITDVWGTTYNIDNVDVIIPTSMFKLHQSYESYKQYEANCNENGYGWRVCKESHAVKASRTNYQMTTDLHMTDEQIITFIQPTIDYLQDVAGRDWLSTVLYLNGQSLTANSTAIRGIEQALMIEPELIHDKTVVAHINENLQKRKKDACLGKYNINSDYQIISSDLYHFMCSACGIEHNGLLKAGEAYSQWHLDRHYTEALLFRAPMISKQNIAKINLVDSSELREFYKYMPWIVVLNDWDLTCDTLAGADKDGDSLQVVTDKTLLEVHEECLPCRCQTYEDGAKKIVCDTKQVLMDGAKLGCSDKYNIGSLINKVTMQYTLRSTFSPKSKEYKELDKRILMGLMYSQSYIDAKKLGGALEPPKHWFYLKDCEKLNCSNEEKEFNKRICTASKKPYFMVMYKGDSGRVKKDYTNKMKEINMRANAYWRLTADELLQIPYDEMNSDQQLLIKHWSAKLPCILTDKSIQHRMCLITEQQLEQVKISTITTDCTHLYKNKEAKQGDIEIEREIENMLNTYDAQRKAIFKQRVFGDEKEVKRRRREQINELQEQLKYIIVDELCDKDAQFALNCFINAINKRKKTYSLVWALFSEEIIENLLKANNYQMQIPIQDDNGNLEYQSKRFRVEIVTVPNEK